MKTMKTAIALVLTLVMALALAIPAGAASITLTGETNQDDHVYNVYQIFTGKVVTKTVGEGDNQTTVKELQNVKYGANYKEGKVGASVPKGELDALNDNNIRSFAYDLMHNDSSDLYGNPVAQLSKSNNFAASDLAAGYYLIVDTVTGQVLDEGDVFSQYIVEVLGEEQIAVKKDVTSSDKTITADEHPSTGDNAEGGDANPGISSDGKVDNVSIGDKVTFTITAKVPAHATDYDYYYFIINDTLSAGLDFDSSTVTVRTDKATPDTADDAPLVKDADYKLYTGEDVTPAAEGGTPHTFEIALLNAKAHPGETITVTYQATLNKDAVIGGDGNLNTQDVTYSNNPNETYDGTQDKDKPGKPASTSTVPLGETPDSTTKTFTSGIKLQKLDQDGMALTGATFTIEGDSINKVVTNTEAFEQDAQGAYWKLKTGAYTDQAPQTEDTMIAAPAGATDGYVLWKEGDSEDKVTVDGKDYRVVRDGENPTHIVQKANADLYDNTTTKYKKTTTESVQETTDHVSQALTVNPDGTLNFEGLGAGTYTIKETAAPEGYTKAADVTVVITFDNTTKQFTATVAGQAVTADATTNLFPVDVVNVAGNVLPETGGIGTKIFYTMGAVLVIGAGVVLVSRKRAAE